MKVTPTALAEVLVFEPHVIDDEPASSSTVLMCAVSPFRRFAVFLPLGRRRAGPAAKNSGGLLLA